MIRSPDRLCRWITAFVNVVRPSSHITADVVNKVRPSQPVDHSHRPLCYQCDIMRKSNRKRASFLSQWRYPCYYYVNFYSLVKDNDLFCKNGCANVCGLLWRRETPLLDVFKMCYFPVSGVFQYFTKDVVFTLGF